jgi:hypothetical protein
MNWDAFWAVMLVMLVWVPLLLIWSFSLVDLFLRRDLRGWVKSLWLLAILVFPIVGTVLYHIFRRIGLRYPSDQPSETAATTDRLSTLADLRTQGIISQEEYDRGRAAILGA